MADLAKPQSPGLPEHFWCCVTFLMLQEWVKVEQFKKQKKTNKGQTPSTHAFQKISLQHQNIVQEFTLGRERKISCTSIGPIAIISELLVFVISTRYPST